MTDNQPDPGSGGTPGQPPPDQGRPFSGPPPGQPYGQPPSYPPPSYPPPPQPGPPSPPAGFPGAPGLMSPEDQRLWATLAHLGGLLFGFLAPLVVFLITKDRGQFVRSQSAEALNFRITVDVGLVVSAILTIVLIGFLGLLIIGVGSLVLQIVAAVAANRGEDYRYPVNIRLVQ